MTQHERELSRVQVSTTSVLHIGAIWTLAVAQPILDLLGRSPEFLIAHRVRFGEVAAGTVLLVFVPPVLMTVLLAVAGELFGRRVERGGTVAVLAALVGALVLVACSQSSLSPTAVFAVAGFGAACFTVAYARFPAARSLVSVLSVALVAAPALFLSASRVTALAQRRPNAHHGPTRQPSELPPLVFVIFDELPLASLLDADGRVDALRYPTFARLAASSTWYRNTTTIASETSTAVPALLTGNLPRAEQLPTASNHPHNLFTLLAPYYTLNVHETMTQLCSHQLCPPWEPSTVRMRSLASDLAVVYGHLLLPRSVSRATLPDISANWTDFRSQRALRTKADWMETIKGAAREDRPLLFRRFVASLTSASGPVLHFLHTILPHGPYEYLPDGRTYGRPSNEGLDKRWSDDPAAARLGYQRHLLQTRFADRLLGELLERLQNLGLYDDSLLVVAADHGAAFRPGVLHRELDADNLADLLPVPLFVKEPNQRVGRVSDEQVETIDVLPTLAWRLGIELDAEVDGHVIGSRAAREARVTVHLGTPARMVARPRLDAVSRIVGHKIDLFGDGTLGTDSLYVFPRYSKLFGKRTDELLCATDEYVEGHLAHARVVLDPNAPVVPTYAEGLAAGETTPDTEVVLAVDGVVALGSQTFRSGGRLKGFAAILPPTALHPGENELSAYVVRRGGQSPCLVPIVPRDGSAVWRMQGGELLSVDGSRVSAEDGGLVGWVDEVRIEGTNLHVSGWAADERAGDVAQAVLVFADDHSVSRVSPTLSRLDVASARANPAFRYSGFSASVPLAALPAGHYTLRVFAMADSRASELAPGFACSPDRRGLNCTPIQQSKSQHAAQARRSHTGIYD